MTGTLQMPRSSPHDSQQRDTRSTDVVVVASSPPTLNDRPSVDPTGQRVVFVSTRGSGPRTDNVGWAALHVASLPAGSVRGRVGSPQHHQQGTGPSPAVRITPEGCTDYSPAWSPSGHWIAAANGTGDVGGTDIVVMRPDGTDRRVVATDGGWPTWAPNSSVIYFHRSEGGDFHNWRIYAVDFDDASSTHDGASDGDAVVPTPRVVSPDGWSVLTPSAHPADPTRLAVAAIVNGTRHIAVLDLSRGNIVPVTPNRPGALVSSAHWNPTWSNDGENIVFSRCRGQGTTAPNLRAVASPLAGAFCVPAGPSFCFAL